MRSSCITILGCRRLIDASRGWTNGQPSGGRPSRSNTQKSDPTAVHTDTYLVSHVHTCHRVGVWFLTGTVLLAFHSISPKPALLAFYSLIWGWGLDFWHFSHNTRTRTFFFSGVRATGVVSSVPRHAKGTLSCISPMTLPDAPLSYYVPCKCVAIVCV